MYALILFVMLFVYHFNSLVRPTSYMRSGSGSRNGKINVLKYIFRASLNFNLPMLEAIPETTFCLGYSVDGVIGMGNIRAHVALFGV